MPPDSTDNDLPELPAAFRELLDALVPAAQRPLADHSYTVSKQVYFRLNPLRGSTGPTLKDLEPLLPEPVTGAPDVFSLPAHHRQTLTHHPAAGDGRIYIQGLSSMAAVWALQPRPGEEVLDLAAAPGGKTSYIAALMNNTGRLAAVEPARARYFKLKANLQRLGVSNTHTYLKDGAVVGRLTPERFDRILLDAPCSSEAQFTRLDATSWQHWSPRKVKESARLQARLIRSAVAALKPGGTLVYSTCSLSPEEDECVLSGMLQQHPEMSPEPLPDMPALPWLGGLTEWKGQPLDPRLTAARRILPSGHTDAFFICRLRKSPA